MPVTFDSTIVRKSFHSILFKDAGDSSNTTIPSKDLPDYFTDLNLNQIMRAVISGREGYDLTDFFRTPLHRVDAIIYRQQVMKDMEDPSLFNHISSFSKDMQEMGKALSYAAKSQYKYQRQRLFLDAVKHYLGAIKFLADHLLQDDLRSPGFIAFRDYLISYIHDNRFTSLFDETADLSNALSAVRYCIFTKDLSVRVLPYAGEADYSREIETIFSKFNQHEVKDYRIAFASSPAMNHVEASILDGVVQLYPGLFNRLGNFCEKNRNFQDAVIATFDREIQFYVAYLEYISEIKNSGLAFCYPEISKVSKEVYSEESFDLALARQLTERHRPVITNNFYLKGNERIIIVSGPNQGGKTTFARTFGQLHYLACLGCPVPGRKAALFLFDQLFTHFEREEDIHTHRSKFEDDLVRIHAMMSQSLRNSIIIMNEILSSTTLQDAIFLSKIIMKKIAEEDALCVWVTFIDELTGVSNKTVSMTSMVEKEHPASRTFKIVRRPADGLAYALSIAEQYQVTYDYLKARLKS